MVQGDFQSTTRPAVRRPGPPRELNVFDHIHVIYRYRWLILPLCILAGGVVGTVSYLWPPSYVATASIMPPMEGSGDSGLGLGLLGTGGSALLRKVMSVGTAADMYMGILDSHVVQEAIMDRFELIRVYEETNRHRTASMLRRNTSVNTSKEGILYVTVEDADPNRAAAMANAYVEELDKQNKRLALGQVSSKRVFLEGRLQEVEQKLSRIESLPSREAMIQETLYELLMRELEIAKIEEAKSMPTIQVLDPAVPPEIRKPKGTIRKAALAGIVAFVCVVFLAFGREYYIGYKRQESELSGVDRDSRKPAGGPTDRSGGRSTSLATDPG